MTTFEITSSILSFIGVSAIIFAARQININRKQLFLSTITKCIDDFRNCGELKRQTDNSLTINRYIDLTNEELFYFQHKYIPDDISKEWIDGMIDFIPITDRGQKILNEEHCIKYIADNRSTLFHSFPRIQNAFEVGESYDFKLIFSMDEKGRKERMRERKKLIDEIQKNIKQFDWFH